MTAATDTLQYICPGERSPISRSVHLARLASGFPACVQCPLQNDTRAVGKGAGAASAPPFSADKKPSTVRSEHGRPRDIFETEGIRGVFLNELTAGLADRIAVATASLLWEQSPVGGRNDGIDRGARQVRPTVVAGYDERPSSPGVFSGVVAGLRRMGCHVLDVGLTTKPCFRFAVHHVHASGGMLVTGAGCEPSWTGIDIVQRNACPLSLGSGLEIVRERLAGGTGRPTRIAGSHRPFQAATPYEASLASQYAWQRPLAIAMACPSQLVRRTLEGLITSRSCRLIPVPVSVRVRNPAHRRDADMLRLSAAVREAKADLGVLIDDDGQRLGWIDDRGRSVSPVSIARLVVPPLLAESSEPRRGASHASATVLLEPGALSEMRPLLEAMGARCLLAPGTAGATVAAMGKGEALYSGGDSGRHWFADLTASAESPFIHCDALSVLAKTLTALGRTSVPFSELVAA